MKENAMNINYNIKIKYILFEKLKKKILFI